MHEGREKSLNLLEIVYFYAFRSAFSPSVIEYFYYTGSWLDSALYGTKFKAIEVLDYCNT